MSDTHHTPLALSVVGVFEMNVVLVLLLGGAFHWLRRRNKWFYWPRSNRVGRSYRWMLRTLRVSEEEVVERSGVDAYLYLEFQKHILLLLLFLVLVGMFVVMPWNMYGENQLEGLARTTIAKIPRHSQLLWFHLFISLVFSGAAYYAVFRFFKRFTAVRFLYKQRSRSLFSVMIRGVPTHITDDAELKLYFRDNYSKRVVKGIQVALDLAHLHKLYEWRDEMIKRRERCMTVEQGTGRAQYLLRLGANWLPQWRHAMSYYENEIAEMEAQISEQKKIKPTGVGVAFVTFTKVSYAREFLADHKRGAQAARLHQFGILNSANWQCSFAPEASDVIWDNLAVSPTEHTLRMAGVGAAVFFLVFFWSIPVGFFANIENLEQLPGTRHTLEQLFTHYPALRFFLHAYLPILLTLLFLTYLPVLLMSMSRREAHFTVSALDKSVIRKYVSFMLLNSLVFPIIYATSLHALVQQVTQHSMSVVKALGSVFESNTAVAYFVTYVINVGGLVNMTELLRFPAFVKQWLQRRKAVTQIDVDDAERIERFVYSESFGWQLTVFGIIMFFAVPVPVILPFGFIFFAIKHFVDRYNLAWVHPRSAESNGTIVPQVITFTLLCIWLSQVALLGFFIVYAPMLVVWVQATLPMITVGWYLYYNSLDHTASEMRERKVDPHLVSPLLGRREETESILQESGAGLELGEAQLRDILPSPMQSDASSDGANSMDEAQFKAFFDSPATEEAQRAMLAELGGDVEGGGGGGSASRDRSSSWVRDTPLYVHPLVVREHLRFG